MSLIRDEKTGSDRRVASLQEVIEQRFEKLNQDLSIMQSRAGVKEQVSMKNLDQLMNLLGKKIQKFNFADTVIGQNHYKLVQKGMDAPQLERKLQEQRFLAEKELSNTTGQEKSVFWMDISFSKEGIDEYLEKNQNFVAFKAVDTMRSVHTTGDTFANRLMAKKNQLSGVMGNSSAGPFTKGMRFDMIAEQSSSSYLQQPERMEVYMRAMKQFQLGGFARYADYLGKHSRDFKEVWQLLEKMAVGAGRRRSENLQLAYQEGVYYLERMYRKQLKHKKQNFQRIYEVYNVDQIRSFEDESMPLWQEMYQLFRAGDYKSIFLRCEQYIDVPEVQEFGQDLTMWLNGAERKKNSLGQKMRPNWDAFRYQIYLILMKDPQCVDDVFIEDLDDCLWMNLKCCQASVQEEEGYTRRSQNFNGDSMDNLYEVNNTQESELGVENFYESILEAAGAGASAIGNIKGHDNLGNEAYSWIDWQQLQDLRKMLYESFKESPDVFNPSRVLVIQLLTLDFIGFAQTLRSLEKNGISQDECVHLIILIMKTGLVRASVECAVKNAESQPENELKMCREFEQFAEKYILLYATEIFESYPDLSLSYVQTLPLSTYTQLSRFAEIIVGSKQDCRALFEKKTSTSGTIGRTQWEQQVFTVNHRMKNAIIVTSDEQDRDQSQLSILATIVAQVLVKKHHRVETALEILESVSAFEEIGILVKEQYRILASVYETQSVKNHLKNATGNKTSTMSDILEKFAEKYFTQKAKIVYKDERKQRIDAHIVQFYRLSRKIKQLYQISDLIAITSTLQQMQELHYISSAHRESAASEFYDSLKKEDLSKASYFEFLYLFYLSCKKFFENLKNSSLYNHAHQPHKPEDIEKAKKIFKNILSHSNTFYSKYAHDIDKDFEIYLNKAKIEAQSASQI